MVFPDDRAPPRGLLCVAYAKLGGGCVCGALAVRFRAAAAGPAVCLQDPEPYTAYTTPYT